MALISVNPTTNEEFARYDEFTGQEINETIEKTHKAYLQWRETSTGIRAYHIMKASSILRRRCFELGEMMSLEMGKPLKESIAEIEKCAWVCDYYAENATSYLAAEEIRTEASKSFVAFEPLGVILAVMPWNFPFWQVFRFAAPAIMAGNAAVLKHASNVTGCALAIEQVMKEAGFPENLFRTIPVGSHAVGDMIRNPLVRAVTLTGSTEAGRAVAASAGSAIKKTVLELGGSDPYVILEDADLELAAQQCVTSRLINTGQSCIAAKRFIVVEAVRDDFTKLVLDRMREFTPGNPLNEATVIGPMARCDLRDELHDQVVRSIEVGAKCILGGEIPEKPGAWYPPTILTGVKKGMPAYSEEIFGPVAVIIGATNEDDAIRIANDTSFGLGAAIFSEDAHRAGEIAWKKLRAGCCFVNGFVRSDPRLPFGGIGESGYGRELSLYGIREFVNIKTVYIS